MLEDDEAIATVLGLKLVAGGVTGSESTVDVAKRAEKKIYRILPPKLRRTVGAFVATADVSANVGLLPETGLLKKITLAIKAQRIVTFNYTKESGTSRRKVEPARLVRLRQRWYLFAWDTQRNDWRTFRLDKMSDLLVELHHYHPRPLPADNLQSYLAEQFHSVPERSVVLTFHTGAEDAATRLHRIDGNLEPLSDDSCRYTAHVDSYEWLALVLILTDIEFSIESPEEFRHYLANHANRLLRGTGHWK